MAKDINQLLADAAAGYDSSATGQSEGNSAQASTNPLRDVFGEDLSALRYTPKEMTQAEFDASPEGQTLERLSDQLKGGGNRFARSQWFRLRSAAEAKILTMQQLIADAEAKLVEAEKPLWEMTPEELAQGGPRPDAKMLRQNIERQKEALEQAQASKIEYNNKIRENDIAAKYIAENTGVSPATQKFMDPDATAMDMLRAAKDDGFGMVGDLLAQNAPSLAGNIALGVATGGSSLGAKMTAQGLWEANYTTMDEFATALMEESGEDIDLSDTEVIDKLFANREEIEAARKKALKAGSVAGAAGFLSTFLAMKGIIPVNKLASKPKTKLGAEVGAQALAQGTVGAVGEAGVAAAAERDITPGEMVAGGVLGIASGTVDAVTSRNPRAEAAQTDPDLAVTPQEAAPTTAALNENLDAIYGDSDRAVAEMDIPTSRRDDARRALEQAMSDETVSPERVEELRIAAIAEQQDYDAAVASAGRPAAPAEDIEQVAKSTPVDDPQVEAYRAQRDGPKSEFDVPESDPRFTAAEDVKGEENLILREAALERFNNPEVYGESRQSGNSPALREGVDQGLRSEEGRLERQPIESQQLGRERDDGGDDRRLREGNDQDFQQQEVRSEGQSGQRDSVNADRNQSVQQDQRIDEVGTESVNRQQERQSSDQSDATQEVLAANRPREGSRPPSGDPAEFNRQVLQDIDAVKTKERKAVDAEVERIMNDSNANMTGVNTPADLTDTRLRDEIAAMERGTNAEVKAVFDPKTDRMYIFKDRMANEQEVRDLTLHEASHAARNSDTMGDKNARAEVLELHEAMGGHQAVMDYAKANGIDLSFYENRYAAIPEDQKAYMMTDELLAMIHGKESGHKKQLARRALSKLENLIRDFTGKDVDLFKRTGGRDVIDGKVMRQIASAERTMRNNRILGSKYGMLSAPKDLVARDVLPWSAPDWMPNVLGRLADTDRGIRGSEWWRKKMRADRGLGSEGMRTIVAKDAALRESNVKVHDKLNRLEGVMKDVPKAQRKALSKRAASFLNDVNDDGADIPAVLMDILEGMRADVDNGSIAIHDVVLTDQLRSKVWKLVQSDRAEYVPDGEDSLVTRIDNWKKRPADRDDPEKEDYFKLIPPVIKRHIELMEKVSDNIGSYMRRAYRAHSDSTYRQSVMSDKPKVETFAKWLVEMDRENSKEGKMRASAKRHKKLIDSHKGSHQKTIDKADARLAKAQKAFDERPDMEMTEARALLSQILEKASGIESANMVSGGNIMNIDKSSFKAQTLEDTRMRKILGEYDDVETVYAQSVNTVDAIVANHQMQKSMLPVLEKMGFVSQTKSRDAIAKDPIEKPMMENEPMAILNGFFTTPVVDAAITNAVNGFQLSQNKILASLVKSSAAVNYGKTILSPSTHVGNYVSNYFVRTANGHLFTKGLGKEHSFMKRLLVDKDPKAIAEYREFTRLGVASETVDINELADILGNSKGDLRQRIEAWIDDPEVMTIADIENSIDAVKLSAKKLGKLRNFVESMYGAEDDLFKIAAYRRELDMAKKYKGLEGEEAKQYAAQRVRDGHLMYSELNQLVKDIKNAPGIGVFVSFPAALIKAAKGQIRLAAQDLLDEDLPSSVRVQRAVGLGVAYSTTSAIAGLSALAAGIGGDEEEDWRKTLPPWAQQNDIVFLGRETNGDPRYIDISRYDPFSYFEVGMRELTKSNDDSFLGVNTNLYDMAWSYASPFVGLNIMTGALVEAATGVNLTTKSRVTNPALSAEAQGMDRIGQFATTVMPGFAAQGANVFDAAVNDKKWYGSENSTGTAVMRMFGVNLGRLDRDVGMRFFTSGIKRELSNAGSIVSRTMGDMSNPAEYSGIKESLYARRTAEMKTYGDALKMIKVMRELDLSEDKIRGILKVYKISGKVVDNLLAGEFPQPKVSGREGSTAYKTALQLADSPEERAEVEVERERRLDFLRRAQEEWLESDELKDLVQ